MTINGPVDAMRGFLNGTRLEKNHFYHNCEDILDNKITVDLELVVNKTGTILETYAFYENIYNVFDAAMYTTRIAQQLHPALQNCIGAGEYSYEQLYDIVWNQNGYNPKTYLMNTIYNFGDIFDGLRDVYLFYI